jgi:hypothetical protein
MIRQ